MKQATQQKVLLAPIRPPRGFKAPPITQETVEMVTKKIDSFGKDLENADQDFDPTILNSTEAAKISSPSSCNSRHSEVIKLFKFNLMILISNKILKKCFYALHRTERPFAEIPSK